jgi:Flp pilus assembly protein TadD
MRCEEVFRRLAEQRPGDARLWCERGRFLAQRSRWKDAAEAYARAGESGRPWNEYALVLLLADDVEGYRRLCEKLNERNGQSPSAEVPWVLTATLGKDSGVDPARMVAWAKAAVEKKRNKFTLVVLAAAEYRAGRFEEAIRHAQQALDQQAARSEVAFLLALAYHRLGKHAESRMWYDIGRNELQRATPRNPGDPAPWAVTHWMYVNLSAREAQAVLGDESAPPRPATGQAMP